MERRNEVWPMNAIDLQEAGCSDDLLCRCQQLEQSGKVDELLKLLKLHRAELVVALHEAQRPIDVCDWIIRGLETSHA